MGLSRFKFKFKIPVQEVVLNALSELNIKNLFLIVTGMSRWVSLQTLVSKGNTPYKRNTYFHMEIGWKQEGKITHSVKH